MDDLDEPVVRKDNSFFLNHDAMGKKNGNGAIFMDQHTDLLMRPYTILLYGHNMSRHRMFGDVNLYFQHYGPNGERIGSYVVETLQGVLEEKGVEELKTTNFIVRWKEMVKKNLTFLGRCGMVELLSRVRKRQAR